MARSSSAPPEPEILPRPNRLTDYTTEVPTPPKRRRGRATRCTPSVVATICDFVRKGNYLTVAAAAAGVSADAVQDWRRRGIEEGREPYRTFAAKLEAAELECEQALVEKFHTAAVSGDDPRVTRDFLALRFRERWGKESAQQSSGLQMFAINIITGDNQADASPEEAIEVPKVIKFSIPPPDGSKITE